jgi:hypothetical protein
VISEAVRQRLRYVRVAHPNTTLEHFPDFLIVGPQRTGTTWLHAHLRFHPEIFLAEPKELFFFSSLKTPHSSRYESNELEWYLRFFRDPWWRYLAKTGITLWRYRRLYRPRVRGEATASYSVLDPDVIADIAALRPDIKVIMMIRNPIDRAWSHAKKDLARNRERRVGDVSPSEFERFFTDPYQRRCAQYADNCDNWAGYLQPGHLFIRQFDDVKGHPQQLLLDTMTFLGVTSDRRYIGDDVRRSVNPTETNAVPDRYRDFLADLFRDDIAKCRERFGVSW